MNYSDSDNSPDASDLTKCRFRYRCIYTNNQYVTQTTLHFSISPRICIFQLVMFFKNQSIFSYLPEIDNSQKALSPALFGQLTGHMIKSICNSEIHFTLTGAPLYAFKDHVFPAKMTYFRWICTLQASASGPSCTLLMPGEILNVFSSKNVVPGRVLKSHALTHAFQPILTLRRNG